MSSSPIAAAIKSAGERLLAVAEWEFPHLLNSVLNEFLGWPYRAASARVIDSQGNRTDAFGSVVYVTSATAPMSESLEIPSDSVACVIETCEVLDPETLHSAYEKIAQAKRLKKAEAPHTSGYPTTTVTVGIIVARQSSVALDILAEEIQSLNGKYSDREWPEMVAVLSKGCISYAVQFPGEHGLGDMLPPAEGALGSITPPWYVILAIKPTGAFTFNRLFSYMLAHLAIFSPGAKLPNWHEVLEGTPKEILTICGYQYNLRGELRPVPRQFYNDRYLPPRPFRIEGPKGEPLAALQFIPWQDGGVILLRGKLPLEGLVVFLGKDVLKKAGTVRRPPDTQLSYVLPITQQDFGVMLQRIQKQSNMVVRSDESKFVVQKFADEGSSSPFMARLFMGILRLRDVIYPNGRERDKFDEKYDFILTNLLNVRTSADDIRRLVENHLRDVSDGRIARIARNAIQVDQSIDKPLRKELDAFLNAAVRVLKQGVQEFAAILGVDIGFLFQKQTSFEKGLSALEKSDPHLADYLRQARNWSESLVESRNDIEHRGWTLPRVKYIERGEHVVAEEPLVRHQTVTEFATMMFDRLSCFVEEITTHCIQRLMPAGISITEIPLAEREREAPERFRLTLAEGGMRLWRITYHTDKFEDT